MRHFLWRRQIHILAVLILLTGINIYLLTKLFRCSAEGDDGKATGGEWLVEQAVSIRRDGAVSTEVPDENGGKDGNVLDEWMSLSPFRMSKARSDNSRQYLVRDFAWTGTQFHSTAVNQEVCLATQSSLDRLHWLTEMADHWRGAISISIYLDDEEEAVLFRRVIAHLRCCHPDLLASMAFHIVSASVAQTPPSSSTSFSSSFPQADSEEPSLYITSNCTGPSSSLKWLLKGRPALSAKWATPWRLYPQNLMRNVARKACPSQYVFLLDIDVIPSFNMAENVARFLDRPAVAHCLKCAFVVPTYELDGRAEFPQNKSQLLQLENQGLAQPFHQKAFRYNQYASNLTRWRQTLDTDDIIIHHNVTNYEFFYEPFYIARDDAPAHDERFVGYGFTRNTQVYEMALSGWSFLVLSPVFTIHHGMQMKQRRPAWRRSQMDRNRRLFDEFIHQELKAKYGQIKSNPIAAVRWRPVRPAGDVSRVTNN